MTSPARDGDLLIQLIPLLVAIAGIKLQPPCQRERQPYNARDAARGAETQVVHPR